MATTFPFSLLPKIPGQIEKLLMPILLEQKNRLQDLALDLASDLANVPANVTCDDPIIAEIKNKVSEITNIIDNIKRILDIIPPITSAFSVLKTIGTIVSVLQLVIPAIPGIPQMPFAEFLRSSAELIDNIEPIGTKLTSIFGDIQTTFGQVANEITRVDALLRNLGGECAAGIDVLATGAFGTIDPNNPSGSDLTNPTGTFVSGDGQDLLDQYPSEFYTNLNVSDPDIQARLDLIIELIQETQNQGPLAIQLLIEEGINEAPSGVIIQPGTPNNLRGQLGDYWIDSSTQQVYGPKPSDTSWS